MALTLGDTSRNVVNILPEIPLLLSGYIDFRADLALTEAMYLGHPVVATDCPSGPDELLAGGRIAPLVPVGDDAALACALASVLDRPPDADRLRAAVADYHPTASTAHYLEVLEGEPGPR